MFIFVYAYISISVYKFIHAYIYMQDTGCNPEDLPEAMNDREKWLERVRDIRAGGTT